MSETRSAPTKRRRRQRSESRKCQNALTRKLRSTRGAPPSTWMHPSHFTPYSWLFLACSRRNSTTSTLPLTWGRLKCKQHYLEMQSSENKRRNRTPRPRMSHLRHILLPLPKDAPKPEQTVETLPLPSDQLPSQPLRRKETASPKGEEPAPLE